MTDIQTIKSLIKRFQKHRLTGTNHPLLWACLSPVTITIIIKTIFSEFHANGDSSFAMIIISGFFFWQLLSLPFTKSLYIISNDRLFFKNLPLKSKVLYPLSWSIEQIIYWFPSISIVIFLSWIKSPPSIAHLILFLTSFLAAIIFVIGLSYLFSALRVLFSEIINILEISTIILLWLSPVFYSVNMIPDHLRAIFIFNPLSWLISSYRLSLNLNEPALSLIMLISGSIILSLLSLYTGYTFYKKHLNEFIKLL